MKLYIVGEGRDTVYKLISEQGEVLAGHFCSSSSFAEGDLYYNRPERIEEYKNKFGEVEVLWLGEDNMTEEELIKRNKDFYDNADLLKEGKE